MKVIESNGWKLQMDDELPILLEEGTIYNIPAYEFHRIIKGEAQRFWWKRDEITT